MSNKIGSGAFPITLKRAYECYEGWQDQPGIKKEEILEWYTKVDKARLESFITRNNWHVILQGTPEETIYAEYEAARKLIEKEIKDILDDPWKSINQKRAAFGLPPVDLIIIDDPKPKTIWCLFSIDNNYDQPNNNLVAWWFNKPTFEQLKKVLQSNDHAFVGKVYRGLRERDNGNYTEYRLEEKQEGEVK